MAWKPYSGSNAPAEHQSNRFTRSDLAVYALLTFPAWGFALHAAASLFGVEG